MLRWLQMLAIASERWRSPTCYRLQRQGGVLQWMDQASPLTETVFVVPQVQGQLKMVPERLRGYYYSIGSLALGALLGVIIYGPMVWTS